MFDSHGRLKIGSITCELTELAGENLYDDRIPRTRAGSWFDLDDLPSPDQIWSEEEDDRDAYWAAIDNQVARENRTGIYFYLDLGYSFENAKMAVEEDEWSAFERQ